MRLFGRNSVISKVTLSLLLLLQNILIVLGGKAILVVGSINADTFLPVARIPTEGENITLRPGCEATVDVPGGKGCTQAVAASKLLSSSSSSTDDIGNKVAFVGQFGNDAAAITLREALTEAHVDLSHCGSGHKNLPSGRGYVFLTESGSVSAVVCGGSNADGWKDWEQAYLMNDNEITKDTLAYIRNMLTKDTKCIMLQREVPEYVNRMLAAEARERGILVLQDIGGEDRPMDREMMQLCDYIIPNETELDRLVQSFGVPNDHDTLQDMKDDVVTKARYLQKHGARNVLVTQGSRGSTLVQESSDDVLYQPACVLESSSAVVDETGAGDCYRAAFAVALIEGKSLQKCMEFASSAGACSVTKPGAVPSTPTRDDVERLLKQQPITSVPRGGGSSDEGGDETFPFLFGSRLNSMKDRPELWDKPLEDASDWVKRQGTIRGLGCVDFNYPQHFHAWDTPEAKAALEEAGLVAGAVCLRFPKKFARGAMNHPDPDLRKEAIQLTKDAAKTALELGCDEVVVWSAYDGYDYPFQVDYDEKWSQLVEAFRECCDAYPNVKFSIEYKPTDENTRFFTVPSTGAALLLVKEIDRNNMGLTLDVGHMLMSGENPAQSISMTGRKLFGIQLNDGYTRLAAEDGMMFGSIHPSLALEIVYQLQRINYTGHLYFDTFPQRTDPIKEGEYNIDRVKKFWNAVKSMNKEKLEQAMNEHDAIAALELIDEALRNT
mmetsp:Transcript_13229/g.18729  ORF Transcript_13229/g.18729 Transcript_13229/m.18729 type:complete len:722 (-) Transcript_13229:1969-4134(-)